jgi:SAM-dependent methyltransferase
MANRPSPPDDAEIATIFERLRREVAARPSGDEPPGTSGPFGTDGSLSVARDQAERFWAVTADRPYLYKPGAWGRVRGLLLVPVKAVLRRLMRWYVEPALAQQRGFNSQVLGALDELSERIDGLGGQLAATADEFRAATEPMRDALVRAERSLTELDERLLRVERRARRSEQPAVPPMSAQPPPAGAEEPDYFAFESRMRGSSELIRERQTVYTDEFRDAAPVLDIGCGRGEFLSLLRDGGVEARGIDADPDMVAHCRDEGLNVELADAVGYLSGLDDGSLGGIFCAHVVEHLDPKALFRLLELAATKLRPGGLFVAETPNPLSLIALANFTADLSHDRPLHPSTLSFLLRQAGFREVTLRFTSEPAADERLRPVPLPEEPAFAQAQQLLDADVNRLNDVVFGPQDYAVLART